MIPYASHEVKATAPPRPRQIPFSFRADPVALDGLRLTRTARAVFALVLDNARSRGWRSRLSNGTMGRVLGCCDMTIGRALLALERAGLIARDFTHGGRVRTGIRVTWDALQQPCGTERACVQQERGTGPTSAWDGVQQSCGTNQSLPQSGDQTGILPLVEDPGTPPDPATAARYLRACIEAGRKGAPQPPPPSRVQPAPPPAPDPVFANSQNAAPPSGPRQDSPRGEVARMLDQLASNFTTGRLASRRLSPQALARQLGEMRRRHGAGKAPPRA